MSINISSQTVNRGHYIDPLNPESEEGSVFRQSERYIYPVTRKVFLGCGAGVCLTAYVIGISHFIPSVLCSLVGVSVIDFLYRSIEDSENSS